MHILKKKLIALLKSNVFWTIIIASIILLIDIKTDNYQKESEYNEKLILELSFYMLPTILDSTFVSQQISFATYKHLLIVDKLTCLKEKKSSYCQYIQDLEKNLSDLEIKFEKLGEDIEMNAKNFDKILNSKEKIDDFSNKHIDYLINFKIVLLVATICYGIFSLLFKKI